MPEEFGTKDVLEQVDTRLTNVEQDVRAFRTEMRQEFAAARSEMREEFAAVRSEMREEFAAVRSEMRGEFVAVRSEMKDGFAIQDRNTNVLRSEMTTLHGELAARLESNTRWMIGLMFAGWISVMASFWLKP